MRFNKSWICGAWMFFLIISLVKCFNLEKGKKTIITANEPGLSLAFDGKHILAGEKVSSVIFDKIEEDTYNIRFDGVSVCEKNFEGRIGGCSAGMWKVKSDGPLFEIIGKDQNGEERCWIQNGKSGKAKIRTGKCGDKMAKFKIEDEDINLPEHKRAISGREQLLKLSMAKGKGFLDHEGWESEEISSEEVFDERTSPYIPSSSNINPGYDGVLPLSHRPRDTDPTPLSIIPNTMSCLRKNMADFSSGRKNSDLTSLARIGNMFFPGVSPVVEFGQSLLSCLGQSDSADILPVSSGVALG